MCLYHSKKTLFSLSLSPASMMDLELQEQIAHPLFLPQPANSMREVRQSPCHLPHPQSIFYTREEPITSSHLHFCDAPHKHRSWLGGFFYLMLTKTVSPEKRLYL